MSKTTPEHERIIDIFDAAITFSYAYEWQKQKSNGINKLIELQENIFLYLQANAIPLFMTSSERAAACISILNMLYQAVRENIFPKEIDFEDFWLNKPKNLSGHYLAEKQDEELSYIIILASEVTTSLNKSLPDEIKPYVTISQVEAIITRVCNEMHKTLTAPIHKRLLASILHQYFLAIQSKNINTQNESSGYEIIVEDYCHKAIQEFVTMVKNDFFSKAVKEFFSFAKEIDIQIDTYYSWTIICFGPPAPKKLLSWYQNVNALGYIEDSHYIGGNKQKGESLDLKLQELYKREHGYQPEIRSSQRFIFDTSYTPVIIDGKSIQNYVVMAFPYDKPLPRVS
jgi:hypothetical protein